MGYRLQEVRAVGEPIIAHPRELSLEEIVAHFSTEQPTVDPDFLLNYAMFFHNEPYCVKHVPGAAVTVTQHGTIYFLSINGYPESTPAHLEEFRPDNLRSLIEQIPEGYQERSLLLQGISNAPNDRPCNCQQLRKLAGTDTCIIGFEHGKTERAKRKAADFCPNARANGCTERKLLNWRPLGVMLQQIIGAPDLVILDVLYSYDSPNEPYVIYTTDLNSPVHALRVQYIPDESLLAETSTTIVSMILPCTACSEAITAAGVSEVCVQRLSQYEERNNDGQPVVWVDGGDLLSLRNMIFHGVTLHCTSKSRPVLRQN
jgi:hypothetical protein